MSVFDEMFTPGQRVQYLVCRVSMEELVKMRGKDPLNFVYGMPCFYARTEAGGIETHPIFDPKVWKLNDNWRTSAEVFVELVVPDPAPNARGDYQCGTCGQWGLHACKEPPAPMMIGVLQDPIVSMVEFKGRLWVATTKGVFVKRENEDAFDPVKLLQATEKTEGRQADEAAGLVPLHPRQTAERSDPFVPNKFGEHG